MHQSNVVQPDFSSIAGTTKPSVPPKEMLRLERTKTQTFIAINSSSLGTILTCPRKAMYSLHQKWKSKLGSPALAYGSAIHKALEVFYSHGCREREMPADFDEVAPLIAQGHVPTHKHFLYDALQAFVREGKSLRLLPDTDKRSIPTGIWTLSHYFKTYLNDAYVIHSDEHGPMTERTVRAIFYESPSLVVELFGTIDFALRNEATGEILIGDHKTSSQMGHDFLNRVKPNHQYTGYIWLAQKVLGIKSENFLVNGIQVKPRAMTTRGTPPTFTRQITRRTDEDFMEFSETLIEAVTNYARWHNTDIWPIGHVDGCASYGGCQYLEVCSAPNQLRQNILEAKFERAT